MEIKGSAVKSIPDYIRKNHPEKYQEWLNAMPDTSRKIFRESILPSNWYPIQEAAIVPTEIMGKLLFNDGPSGAWACGRYSAESALTGIYKFFVKAASPFFIVDRAGKIFTTYYQPSMMEVVAKGEKSVTLHITLFETPSFLLENRIAGWIERAMEIHGVGIVTVKITRSLAKGDPFTEFQVFWDK
jgi:hypothetical protein